MLFSESRRRHSLLGQHALRCLGNEVGVGVGGVLPFLGDDPSEDVFVDLKVAIDLWQGLRFDEKLQLPHYGLRVSTTDSVAARASACRQDLAGPQGNAHTSSYLLPAFLIG